MALNKQFHIEATIRNDRGKGASRRLRREDKIPAIVYGGGKDPISLVLEHSKIAKSLENDAFYSSILSLKTGSDSERVILKDVQRHPYKPRITHLDFQRVRADEKLTLSIPLVFIGEEKAPGVEVSGGKIFYLENDAEVSCLPDDLPEKLEIDISNMQLNEILHLSDIPLPKGVELVALAHGDNKPIISIHVPREEEEPALTEGEPISAEVPASAQKGEGEEGKEGK